MADVRKPRFLKPSDARDEPAKRACLQERGDAGAVFNNPYASYSIQQQRARLPIFKNRNHILYLLEKFQCVVVVGETGCGKSTQVPQYLAEAGWATNGKKIAVTQPRRVAAVTLADRVAEEHQSVLGHEVGYVVRFDDCTHPDLTKIKYMTDGILLREIMSDPLLTGYSVVMVDEAHERSLATDIILGLLRKIIEKRTDLRIIVSSATLDADLFHDYFNLRKLDEEKDTSSVISVEGRQYPVQILYSKNPVPNYVRAAVNCALDIHKNQPSGDILAFLTGQDEVDSACQLLADGAKSVKNVDKLWVLPLYGTLPMREQLKVFDSTPAGVRKVVVATNIAETSLTIPGIVYIIDCGFVKLRCPNKKCGLEALMTVPISRASADQRAGRAGRIRPGKAFRLYPEKEYLALSAATTPEIQRIDLASAILQLKVLGIQNVLNFNYLSAPPSVSMIAGLELLFALGALDQRGHLTSPLGLQMAEFPLSPMHAKALLNSGEFGCSEQMVSIIAMMQIQDVFLTAPAGKKHAAEVIKRQFSVEEGDHLTFLNVFAAFQEAGKKLDWCKQRFLNYRGLCRAAEIRGQLCGYLKRCEIPLVCCQGDEGAEKIRRCLVSGFFRNAAKLHHTGYYHTVRGDFSLKAYKGSAIMYRERYPDWVIFGEVLQDSIRDITVIQPEWLYELAPHYYEYGTDSEIMRKRVRKNEQNL